MVNVDLYSAIITKVSNALDTLVSGEKPGFQTRSPILVTLNTNANQGAYFPRGEGKCLVTAYQTGTGIQELLSAVPLNSPITYWASIIYHCQLFTDKQTKQAQLVHYSQGINQPINKVPPGNKQP